MHVRLRTKKNGPTIRNRLRLPHSVKSNVRIAVICPPDSTVAAAAREAGAHLVGEEEIFEAVKAGKIEFERCVCHTGSFQKLSKANLGRILGPKGLMPSAKTGTVVDNVANTVKNLAGGAEYRERLGVIRMAIGQLAFTPEEMQRNIKTFMDQLKKDMALMTDRITKEIHEVVRPGICDLSCGTFR
jgi:large subunit ribosomal protein L1